MDDLPRFREKTIQKLLENSLAEHNCGVKVKIPSSTVELIAEYLRYVVLEATDRAMSVSGDDSVLDENHLEKILPQLLLDIA